MTGPDPSDYAGVLAILDEIIDQLRTPPTEADAK
jgi:hypothetical protein